MEIRQIITDDEEFRKNMETIEQVSKTKKNLHNKTQIKNMQGESLYVSVHIVYYDKNHDLGFVRNISDIENERIRKERSNFFLKSFLGIACRSSPSPIHSVNLSIVTPSCAMIPHLPFLLYLSTAATPSLYSSSQSLSDS